MVASTEGCSGFVLTGATQAEHTSRLVFGPQLRHVFIRFWSLMMFCSPLPKANAAKCYEDFSGRILRGGWTPVVEALTPPWTQGTDPTRSPWPAGKGARLVILVGTCVGLRPIDKPAPFPTQTTYSPNTSRDISGPQAARIAIIGLSQAPQPYPVFELRLLPHPARRLVPSGSGNPRRSRYGAHSDQP
jgi:hypothetical protein